MSRSRLRRAALPLLGALLWVVPAAADAAPSTVVLTFTEEVTVRNPPPHGEESFARPVRVSFGPRYVREDIGDAGSYVLDREAERLFVLDHGARTWQVYPLPLRIEDHLSAAQADLLALHARRLDRVEPSPPVREIVAGRTAVRSRWTAALEDVEIEATWWLAEIEGVDGASYRRLAESVAALHPVHRLWLSEVALPVGLPVRQVLVVEGRFGERRERKLEAMESRDGALDFSVPAGYRQRPARCFRHLGFGDDPACR